MDINEGFQTLTKIVNQHTKMISDHRVQAIEMFKDIADALSSFNERLCEVEEKLGIERGHRDDFLDFGKRFNFDLDDPEIE